MDYPTDHSLERARFVKMWIGSLSTGSFISFHDSFATTKFGCFRRLSLSPTGCGAGGPRQPLSAATIQVNGSGQTWGGPEAPICTARQRYKSGLFWSTAASWAPQFTHGTSSLREDRLWHGREPAKFQNKAPPAGSESYVDVNPRRLRVNNSQGFRRDLNRVRGKGQLISWILERTRLGKKSF